ncbi:hypothetical protein GCM10020255_092320 [Rhodococcus baikonurensis]
MTEGNVGFMDCFGDRRRGSTADPITSEVLSSASEARRVEAAEPGATETAATDPAQRERIAAARAQKLDDDVDDDGVAGERNCRHGGPAFCFEMW